MVLVPLSAPWCVSGSCRTDPDVRVTAAQFLPTAICAAEVSERLTTRSINIARWPRMTLGAIRADHKEMFLGERDRIRIHAARRQLDRSPKADEVVIPHQLADAI